ncbi:hypothetical protein E8E14_005949 [Neopestalotiopsis sp. 37M]|nr:hypothetical protein E8E14_005949 [Neopestalotiopsis sp. 37M]
MVAKYGYNLQATMPSLEAMLRANGTLPLPIPSPSPTPAPSRGPLPGNLPLDTQAMILCFILWFLYGLVVLLTSPFFRGAVSRIGSHAGFQSLALKWAFVMPSVFALAWFWPLLLIDSIFCDGGGNENSRSSRNRDLEAIPSYLRLGERRRRRRRMRSPRWLPGVGVDPEFDVLPGEYDDDGRWTGMGSSALYLV